jgi:hypothetical protein
MVNGCSVITLFMFSLIIFGHSCDSIVIRYTDYLILWLGPTLFRNLCCKNLIFQPFFHNLGTFLFFLSFFIKYYTNLLHVIRQLRQLRQGFILSPYMCIRVKTLSFSSFLSYFHLIPSHPLTCFLVSRSSSNHSI